MKVRAKFRGIDLKKGFKIGRIYNLEFSITSYYGRIKYNDRIEVTKFGDAYQETLHTYKTMKAFIDEWEIIK